jgi:hypothetical protein
MSSGNHRNSPRESLFNNLNEKLRNLDESIGDNIYCPLCWNIFSRGDLLTNKLTLEHIQPEETAKLIKENIIKTLTCQTCNNTYGSKYQADLQKYIIFQLHQYSKYNGAIRGTLSISDNNLSPLRSNIIWASEGVNIDVAPKANAVSSIKSYKSIFYSMSKNNLESSTFNVTLDYGCRPHIVWAAYIQIAYLMLYHNTNCQYAFTKAGKEIRKGLDKQPSNIGPCIVVPDKINFGGNPWIAEITQPEHLRCFWVKVAGNIVIMPIPDDEKLICFKAWQSVSRQTNIGLRPINIQAILNFPKKEDALVAQQCLILQQIK